MSRVVGYWSVVNNWAAHKKQEFKDRKTYDIDKLTNRAGERIARGAMSGMGPGHGLDQRTADDWAQHDPEAWAEVGDR